MPHQYNCQRCNAEAIVSEYWRVLQICASYGRPVMQSNEGELRQTVEVCIDCYNRYYDSSHTVTAPCCNREVFERQLSRMSCEIAPGLRIACNDCARRRTFLCSHCDERFNINTNAYYTLAGGSRVCEDCYQDSYFTCSRCEDVYHTDYYDSDSDICENCARYSEDRLIHDYSYKPAPWFFGTGGIPDRKKTYFGCELEIYVRNDEYIDEKAQAVINCLNKDYERVYLKNDSSIGRGFEVVTHPHTYSEARKLWLENWREDISGISSHNSGTCGFHVHVSRKNLTPLHIQKMVVFINAPENANLVKTIAQRDCSEWGKLDHRKKIGHCAYSDDRYEAINLSNRQTIEFRIFRGNLRKDRIMKNLEFVKATMDFTRDRSYRDLSANQFIKFISNNKKEFKYLYEYLQGANFYPALEYAGNTDTDR